MSIVNTANKIVYYNSILDHKIEFDPHEAMFDKNCIIDIHRGTTGCERHIISDLVNNRGLDFSKAMIDIGACTGEYSIQLPYQKVYAFEPNKYSRCILAANMALHDRVDEVDLFDCVVSSYDGEIQFNGFEVEDERYIFNTEDQIFHYGEFRTQKCVKLDTLELTNIDFIKIDVERHELEVLNGAMETILREKPKLLIEIAKENFDDVVKLIALNGYVNYWQYDEQNYLFWSI